MTGLLADRIIGAESGGNATARNPRSSATGAGQFIDGTWLATIAKHRPDLASMPRADVLALRNDPTLSREMTAAYASDNAGLLQRAGFEATPGNTYLAHFAGPAGATAVLGADPGTPVASILPRASIDANGFLRSMSAGDLTAWAARKVGDKAPVMTMPGEPARSGGFGFGGATASDRESPAMAMPEPPAEPLADITSLLAALGRGEGGTPPASPPAAPPVAPRRRLAEPAAPAPVFDARRFYELLQGRVR